MSRLLGLPSELRQKILILALPTCVTVSQSVFSPLADFLLICKLINEDILEILKQYEPIYIVTKPAHLPYLQRVKHVSHVKLDLFSTCTIHDLRDHVFPPWVMPTLQSLINQWSAEFVHLPKCALKTSTVDISPVPGYGREKGQRWISVLVNDPKVSNKLFNSNDNQIASLLDVIGTCLKGSDKAKQKQGVALKVEGYLSKKTGERIPHVLEVLERLKRQGIHAQFEPNYLDEKDLPDFDRMINSLATVRLDLNPELRETWKKTRHHVRRALQENKGLRQLFIKNEMKDAAWTMFSTQRLVLLATGQLPEYEVKVELDGKVKSVIFESLEPLERAWLHQMAEVLDLHTLSLNERKNGNVAIKSVKVLKCDELVWMEIIKGDNGYKQTIVESVSDHVEENSRASSRSASVEQR